MSSADSILYVGDLSDDAREVLQRVVAKFRAGAHEHGALDVGSRRWGPELLNEAIDALHYCIFELMRIEKEEEETDTMPDLDSPTTARNIRHVAAADDSTEPFDWSEHTDGDETQCACNPQVERGIVIHYRDPRPGSVEDR